MVKRFGVERGTAVDEEILVQVIWHDAHAVTDTWISVEEIDDTPCIVRSTGVLLPHVKSGHLVLAQSQIHNDGSVDHVIAIPFGMVKRVHKLVVGQLIPLEPESSDD